MKARSGSADRRKAIIPVLIVHSPSQAQSHVTALDSTVENGVLTARDCMYHNARWAPDPSASC
jgi:hypothetical protein